MPRPKIKKSESYEEEFMFDLKSIKDLRFYIVVNSEGRFFRQRGYYDGWADKITSAKFYTKLNSAIDTANDYSEGKYSHFKPQVIEIIAGKFKTLNIKKGLEKAKERDKQRRLEQVQYYETR